MLKHALALAVLVSTMLVAGTVQAGGKSYQVTGPVLEVTDSTIVVQKGKDRWEIGRDASTKVTGDLKVGAKVTVDYRMTATAVEVKPEAAGKKAKAK